eukprot:g333.t1
MLYFLIAVVLGYLLLKESWMRWHYDLHKIPTPPKLPLLGHALQLKRGTKNSAMNVWIQGWRAQLSFPKLMRLCIMGRTVVIVADMDIARQLSLPKSNIVQRIGPVLRHFHRLLMGNDPTPFLFTSPVTTPYVKAIRRSYAESFTSAGMRNIFEKQTEVLNKGILYLEEQQHQDTVDIQEFFRRLMLDLAGKAELDMNLGGLDNSKLIYKLIIDSGHHVHSLFSDPFLELKTKLFPNSKVARIINQDFDDLLEEWTKIANEVVNRGEPDENDISVAANLRRARMPGTDDPLSFNLLRGELAFTIIAGFDSTSHQLSWIFALLATNPSVVDKLLDELRAHNLYGDDAKEFEFEDLSELKYLTAVVKEGMRRIHTMAAVAIRSPTQDVILDKYRIPKDTQIFLCSNLSVNCETEWEDHLAFKPERWLVGNMNLKEKYYLPFGIGERDCIGMKLAMQSMKVVIVHLITRFSFELIGDTIDSLIQYGVVGIVFEAQNGINMKITPRKNT